MSKLWCHNPVLRILVLVLLFGLSPFVEVAHQGSLADLSTADFWWHLRTGLDILQSHSLPHTGLGSQAASLPWIASSWLYDVAVAIGFRIFDLRVLPLLAIACKLSLAVLAFLLARGLTGRFWSAVLLSAAAQFILVNVPPLPVFVAVLLFAVELLLLLHARRIGSIRPLYALPVLFLLWANVDVQFVLGIFVLLLFIAAQAFEQRWGNAATSAPAQLPLTTLGAITAASFLATVVTPYGWRPWGVFFSCLTSAANEYFPDYHALRFRTSNDYLLLLLVAAAFLALGIRRSRDPFSIALLLLAAFASFRSQRDTWLATLAAVAVLADTVPADNPQPQAETPSLLRSQLYIAAGLTVVLLAIAALIHFPHSREAALRHIARSYPVAAANYIREQHLPEPLFNAQPWGGFLQWYLPEYPVAIDGRAELYGDEFNIQYANVMNADVHFSTFPAMNQAATLLLQKDSLLGKALPTVPGFKVAYSDDVAVVLLREQTSP